VETTNRPPARISGSVELSSSTETMTSGGSNETWQSQLAVKIPRSPSCAAVTA
jgi:hypothetical protein